MNPGDRVQLAPHLDRWIMGDRYGAILRTYITGGVPKAVVKLDRSGAELRFNQSDLEVVS